MKKTLFFICSIGIILYSFFAVYTSIKRRGVRLAVGKSIFSVDLAITPEEKERGLGNRKSLGENAGMLFTYDHKEQYNFWMKDMKFPLDFIWIDEEKVVDITPNVYPLPDGRPVVKPLVPVNRILEVNSGMVEKFGIKIGDPVSILK